MSACFWTDHGDHCLVSVRLTPKSRHDRIDGMKALADGKAVLVARVRAVPEDGKANAALCTLMAQSLGLAKSCVSVAGGHAQRVKTLRIEGNPAKVAEGLLGLAGA